MGDQDDSKFIGAVPVLNSQDLDDSRKGGVPYFLNDRKGGVPFLNGQDKVDGKFSGRVPIVFIGGIAALVAIVGAVAVSARLRPAHSEEPLAEGAQLAAKEDPTQNV